MTYLHSVPSAPDSAAFLPPREPRADRLCSAVVRTILFFARSFIAAFPQYGRQTIEARRVRTRLLELDNHLLRDVGLSRADVRFDNIATLARQSHRPAELAHQR